MMRKAENGRKIKNPPSGSQGAERWKKQPDLQLSQCTLEILSDLVGAAGGTGAAGDTLHAGNGILGLHALEQTANALQVTVAAADDLDGLDGVVIVQHDVGLFRAGALVGKAERLAHIQTSSLFLLTRGFAA